MKTGTKLGIFALALAVGSAFLWFRMTATVGLPDDRSCLGVFSYFKGTSIVGAVPPALAILVGAFLTFTVYISPQALDEARSIKVGDTVPRFTALDDNEQTFDSAALHGHLVLIKFFRAHW